jgi:acetoin utilization deacetylase AcuC-like enzyme
MRTAYLTHPACLLHDMGPHHPESPQRLHAIEDQFIATGVMDVLRHHEAPRVTREQLLRVHTAAYIDKVARLAPAEGLVPLDPDTAMNAHSLEAAYRAAGAVVRAVDLVMEGAVENAFCGVRPPGHHASADRAAGFCIFNNVAVGVAHALYHHQLPRVAIVDVDVHHGNGTEAIFRNEPRVLLCSSFQHPWYPHVDLATRAPNTLYAPLPAGANSDDFRRALSEVFLPALEAFRPAFLFMSTGFDAHRADDMGQLGFTESDYAWVTREVIGVANRHAEGRVVSVLEGGYDMNALGRSVTAHVKALMGM